MRERPIHFNGAMVRAVLAGDKTQTRRITGLEFFSRPENDPTGWWCARVNDGQAFMVYKHSPHERAVRCPYGQPGDRLWVREAVRAAELPSGVDGVHYVADGGFVPIQDTLQAAEAWMALNHYRGKCGATVPPIHMPRWACRLKLEITRVRVERLRAINHLDAIAEGVGLNPSAAQVSMTPPEGESLPRVMFRALWEQINGAGAWEEDPWVWVVEFQHMADGERP